MEGGGFDSSSLFSRNACTTLTRYINKISLVGSVYTQFGSKKMHTRGV